MRVVIRFFPCFVFPVHHHLSLFSMKPGINSRFFKVQTMKWNFLLQLFAFPASKFSTFCFTLSKILSQFKYSLKFIWWTISSLDNETKLNPNSIFNRKWKLIETKRSIEWHFYFICKCFDFWNNISVTSSIFWFVQMNTFHEVNVICFCYDNIVKAKLGWKSIKGNNLNIKVGVKWF